MTSIQQAIGVLRDGGIVIYPTDTAFGIGCRIDDKDAIKRLFLIRKRPSTQATPVLVNSIKMAQNFLSPLSDNVRHLMTKYWPGALTIIYPCIKEKVPFLVRGGGETLGVRMPDHKVALTLIEGVGVPILGPSANFHGKPPPFTYEELDKKLLKLVDYVVEGKCKLSKVSTVLDCSKEKWKIIRQGVVKIDPEPEDVFYD